MTDKTEQHYDSTTPPKEGQPAVVIPELKPANGEDQPAAVMPKAKAINTVLDLGLVAREAIVIGIDMNGQFFYHLRGTTHYNALRHIAAAQVAFFHLAHPGFYVKNPELSGQQEKSDK